MDKACDVRGCTALRAKKRHDVCCHLQLHTGLFDAAKETDRLRKQEAKVQKALAGLQGRLANRSFLDNAAPAVVEEVKQQQVTRPNRWGPNLQICVIIGWFAILITAKAKRAFTADYMHWSPRM